MEKLRQLAPAIMLLSSFGLSAQTLSTEYIRFGGGKVIALQRPAALAQITTPAPGTTLPGSSVTFTWTPSTGADNYWLDVGNSVGQGDISAGATTATSKAVSGIPCDGRTIYVQLYTHLNGTWQTPNRYTYTACSASVATMTSPPPLSVLSGTGVTFYWTTAGGADNYWLDVGNAVGQGDISAGATTATSKTVAGIPCDGRTIYVQLWTHLNGAWQTPNRYTYTACSGGLATMTSPSPESIFTGTSVTFTWTSAAGADNYWLDVGNSVGQGDIWGGATTTTSKLVSSIPCDGRTIYVQLWTHLNGTWQIPRQYTYTAWQVCGRITSPAPNSTLAGSTVTFTWLAGTGVTAYWLDVGTVLGQGNIFGANVGGALSQTVNNIPTNGGPIYVQLWSQIGGVWYLNRYSYTAFR
jgi:serine protease